MLINPCCVRNADDWLAVTPVQAKPYKRADFSHSAVDLLKIAHDNQLLVQHLTTISKAVSRHAAWCAWRCVMQRSALHLGP